MRTMLFILVISFFIFSCAGGAGYWKKNGVTPAQLQADYKECQDMVRKQRVVADSIQWGVLVPFAGIMSAIASEEIQHRANKNVKDCMRDKGYAWENE